VFGMASNASNVQVFEARDLARQAYPLNLRGAEVAWIKPPANALEVERSIHRQRASQQEARAATVREPVPTFGRNLEPSSRAPGMLIGLSKDLNLSRDPDDPRDALQTFTADTLDLDEMRKVAGVQSGPFTLSARGFLEVTRDGPYWFSVFADRASCLAIDQEVVLGCKAGLNEGQVLLTAGLHRIDVRYLQVGEEGTLQLRWLPPGSRAFVDLPRDVILQPQLEGGRAR